MSLEGYTVRRPVIEDAEAVHALVSAYDSAVLGHADYTLDEVVDELNDPDFDRERDGWIVQEAGGEVVGWGWACRKGDGERVDVDVYALIAPVKDWLWDAALARARQIGKGPIGTGVFRADAAKRSELEARGFTHATTYLRMYVEHEGRPSPPELAEGTVLYAGPEDETLRREAHRVHQEAFTDHFGNVPKTFDQWTAEIEASTVQDWNLLTLVRVDGTGAAMMFENDSFVPEENCGYVSFLAVHPDFRGRGLGRLLLRHAFASDAAKGRKGTYLHVDSDNRTPAVALYESVGMHPVLEIDVYQLA